MHFVIVTFSKDSNVEQKTGVKCRGKHSYSRKWAHTWFSSFQYSSWKNMMFSGEVHMYGHHIPSIYYHHNQLSYLKKAGVGVLNTIFLLSMSWWQIWIESIWGLLETFTRRTQHGVIQRYRNITIWSMHKLVNPCH